MTSQRSGAALAAFAFGAMVMAAAPASAGPPVRRFALIVANNQSLDEGTPPLAFADDDGAKYYELFHAAQAEATLLTVLDADAQQRFPEAAAAARPPTREALRGALAAIQERIRAATAAGAETHFYFVYSGHGNVGANRQGYVNLADARLHRSELYQLIVAPSPASYNHLILDACHAYFLVNKRGDGGGVGGKDDKEGDFRAAMRDFLESESLVAYPNTGVILAASSQSETHEWSRWQSGIFSHELASALLGAADADGDGQITYDEAAASIEAANTTITEPLAKLRVYYQAPAAQQRVALVTMDAYARRLRLPAAQARRYSLEDSRGVRTADFNPSGEAAVTIALVGRGPHFLKSDALEATIPAGRDDVAGDTLRFAPTAVAAKGSLDETFRARLYELPYGRGFLLGFVAAREHLRSVAAAQAAGAPRGPARGTRLLVASVKANGGTESLASRLTEALRRTADDLGGYEVLSDESGGAGRAEAVLVASIGRAADLFEVTMRLTDRTSGAELGRRVETLSGREEQVQRLTRFLGESLLGGGGTEGTLTVLVGVPGATVFVDGEPKGVAPLATPLTLASGKHRLAVNAPGYAPHAEDVVVLTADPAMVEVQLSALAKDTSRPWRTLAWVSAGLSVLELGGGGVFYALADATHADYLRASDPAQATNLHEKTSEQAAVAQVLFISGGITAGAAAALFVADALRSEDDRTTPGVAVVPREGGLVGVLTVTY